MDATPDRPAAVVKTVGRVPRMQTARVGLAEQRTGRDETTESCLGDCPFLSASTGVVRADLFAGSFDLFVECGHDAANSDSQSLRSR